jgi:hypothetical protein
MPLQSGIAVFPFRDRKFPAKKKICAVSALNPFKHKQVV